MLTNIINTILSYKPQDGLKYLSPWIIPYLVGGLLIISNSFQALAWYQHLHHPNQVFIKSFFISLIYVMFEYVSNVHATSIGSTIFSIFQIKVLKEITEVIVFLVYAYVSFNKIPTWKTLLALILMSISMVLIMN